MVYCDQCGVNAGSHDRYCRICGRPLAPDRISAGLNYCDQCGAKVDLEDNYCRICGRQLNRPSMFWFDVSTVGLPTGEPSEPSRPVSVQLFPAREEPSVAPLPVATSENAVIKEFAAEKGEQFVADYHELQTGLSKSTEPSPIEVLQKVAVSPSAVTAGSRKTFVLEKASITNRKSPAESSRDSSSKSGDTLTKAVTKPPIAPRQLETKSELGPASLSPKMEELVKTQANMPMPTAKSNLAPASLIPKLEKVGKIQASISTEVPRKRHPSSSALIGYGLAGFGGLSLILAVVFTSTVLAFIGLGLTFWGALLLFIRPRHYVRTDLMDSTALSSLTNIDRVITGLGYNEKGIYIPVNNPEKAVVFVSSHPLKEIPTAAQVERQTFVKDPEGITIVPPGMALANLFEKELGVKFTEWSLEKMVERLPKLLIEDLEMVQDCIIRIDGDRVGFKFVESVFSEFCDKLKGTTKVCASLGCPMCSAMACILAQVTHRPVKFEEDKYTVGGRTVESSYRLLTG